eukprot:COSAG01_NODE_8188_length_2885_cov_14.256281_4_plen_55_part_00
MPADAQQALGLHLSTFSPLRASIDFVDFGPHFPADMPADCLLHAGSGSQNLAVG